MPEAHLQDFIERIAQLIRSETRISGADCDLQPIQLSVLYYLLRANRYSDSPLAVTEYFGLTKGTVSQTIKSLEAKGLLERKQDESDRRRAHLKVTPKGKKLIKKTMPVRSISKVWRDMESRVQDELLDHLKNLLHALQGANKIKAFGICKTCRFNSQRSSNRFFCELTQEPLSPPDTELLCREHEAPEV